MGTKHKTDREHKKKKRRRSRSPVARSRSRSPAERSKKRREERTESPPEPRSRSNMPSSTIVSAVSVGGGGGPSGGGGGESSLSIEETNKIRAQLGLKPLEVYEPKPGEEGKADEKKAFVHAPAKNLRQERQSEQQKEKLSIAKEKRKVIEKLSAVRGLGESSGEEEEGGASSWVAKSRKMEREREEAKKRAKLLEAMDAEFGVSDLVEAEVGPNRPDSYDSRALAGLTVEHSLARFKEGQTVIMTLKDRGVLEEEKEETPGRDVLVNVNFQDDEAAAKNVENKKGKPAYRPYDDADVMDEGTGEMRHRDILEKYDSEISGERREQFQLEANGRFEGEHERALARMREEARQQQLSLHTPEPQPLTDFMTPEEMAARRMRRPGAAGFKKRKRKVTSLRSTTLTADDLLVTAGAADTAEEAGDHGRRVGGPTPKTELAKGWEEVGEEDAQRVPRPKEEEKMEVDAEKPVDSAQEMLNFDLSGPHEEDEAGEELQNQLHKVRSLKRLQQFGRRRREMLEAMLEETTAARSQEPTGEATTSATAAAAGEEAGEQANVVLHDTAEFCRTLGDLPRLGLMTSHGGRGRFGTGGLLDASLGEEAEAAELEEEWRAERLRRELAERNAGGWQEVPASGEEDREARSGMDRLTTSAPSQSSAVLEEEPQLSSGGVIAALKLAAQKGYLDHEVKKQAPDTKVYELRAKHFIQENVRYDDIDAKFSKRDRFGQGPISEFREKGSYEPNVKLTYVDETGRELNQKEAFRELSHRFHGKGSGKKKTEKKIKRIKEEFLLKAMSSSDTPLGTVDKLHRKLETEGQPFVLLSGKNAHAPGNSLTK